MGALPYYFEYLFLFTFVSLFCLFYIVIKQREALNRCYLPFFCYFIGFYTPVYLFLSELYPYSNFGFDKTQAIFVLICSCLAIPLLHASVEAGIMSFCKLFFGNWSDIIGFGALWVIGEWVLTLGVLAFPWTAVAVSFTGFLPYLQTASLFGKLFITFITAASCYALAYAVRKKIKLYAFLGIGIILLNTFVGTVLYLTPTQRGDEFKVAAIQGNVLSNEKWDIENNGTIFERYISLTEEAAKSGAELIILPESAIPQRFVPDGAIHRELARITKQYSVTIVTGVHYYDHELAESYNAVIAVLPDGSGSLSEHYDKRHLVPFGEFIPFADTLSDIFPFVAELNLSRVTLVEGKEPTVIETNHGSIGPLVCFDSIFPQFAKESVANGADFISIVTNDSWFNDSVGVYTHLRHAQLRAIENKRYVLRAANTGVSAFIDEHGNIITQTQPLTIDIAYANACRVSGRTLYTYVGDVVLYISFAILLFYFAFYLRSNKNGNH